MKRKLTLLLVLSSAFLACSGTSSPTATPTTDSSAPATSATPAPSADTGPELASDALNVPGEINIAADFANAPNQFFNSEAQMDGLNPAICGEIGERLGLEVKWTNLAIPSLIPALQAGRFDMICTSYFITGERKQIMTMVPYVQWGSGALVKAGNPEGVICSPTKGDDATYQACYEHFSGRTASTGIGGSTERQLREASDRLVAAGKAPIEILGFDSNAEAFQALANDQAIAVQLNDPQAKFYVDEFPGEFEVAFAGQETNVLALAVEKPNLSLAQAVQWALTQMQADGTYDEILDKWGIESSPTFDIPPDE